MKIFITGGTGFIGKHLISRLSKTKHELVCLVRETSKVDELQELGVTLVTGDVTDKDSVCDGMRGCDWVANLANVYTVWEPDKNIYTEVNINGTRNVMECALENKVSRVVHVSTIAIYGKPDVAPIREDTTPGSEFLSEYSRTKYEGDKIAWDLYKNKGLPLTVIYPCPVLGPGDTKVTGELIWGLVNHALPATAFHNSTMTYVDVKDVAEMIVHVFEKKDTIGEKYIAGKEQLSFDDFYRIVSETSGVPLPGIHMPDIVVEYLAKFLTFLADRLKLSPQFGMSVDGVKLSKEGILADGSKAERELGITYTPLWRTIDEAVQFLRTQ